MRERRAALAAARAALTEIGSVLWEEPGVELGPLLREIDDMGRLVDAARMVVVDEAMTRGEMRSYVGPHQEGGEPLDAVAAGLVGVGWVRAWSPTMKAGGAVGLVQLTERLRSYESRQLREAVLGGRVGLRNAAVCVREMDRLAPDCARTRCRRSGMPSSSWGPTSDRGRSERSGRGCWPSMARTESFSTSRTWPPAALGCPSRTTRGTARSSTGCGWTPRARPFSRQP